jgi:quaternary ammonium compound-resistance protein SugE
VPWFVLVVAGLLEVVWATAMERSEGFTRPWPTVVTLVALAGSMGLLALALRDLPLGTAYAVWVGIGAVGTAIVGMAWLGEPVSATRIAFVALILAGVAGLKLTAGPTPD